MLGVVVEVNANIYDEQQVDSEIAIQNSKSVTGVGEFAVRIEERMCCWRRKLNRISASLLSFLNVVVLRARPC